jgi:hypothetical protein
MHFIAQQVRWVEPPLHPPPQASPWPCKSNLNFCSVLKHWGPEEQHCTIIIIITVECAALWEWGGGNVVCLLLASKLLFPKTLMWCSQRAVFANDAKFLPYMVFVYESAVWQEEEEEQQRGCPASSSHYLWTQIQYGVAMWHDKSWETCAFLRR